MIPGSRQAIAFDRQRSRGTALLLGPFQLYGESIIRSLPSARLCVSDVAAPILQKFQGHFLRVRNIHHSVSSASFFRPLERAVPFRTSQVLGSLVRVTRRHDPQGHRNHSEQSETSQSLSLFQACTSW